MKLYCTQLTKNVVAIYILQQLCFPVQQKKKIGLITNVLPQVISHLYHFILNEPRYSDSGLRSRSWSRSRPESEVLAGVGVRVGI